MRQAIAAAVGRLAVIPFFPANEGARLEVMRALEEMIGAGTVYGSTPQQRLDSVVKAAINAMRTWGGIPELRGLLCSRWRPADGIESYSSLPGYSAEDSESLSIAQHRNHQAIEAGRMSPRLLEAAERDRMSADELAQLHRDTIGKLIETTRFPSKHRKSLPDEERELANAPKRSLTEGEKARRLAELEVNLTKGA